MAPISLEHGLPGETAAGIPVSLTGDHGTHDGPAAVEAEVGRCQQEISAGHGTPEIHSGLGVALTTLGRLDEAIANFKVALALEPDFPPALGGLAHALRLQGRIEDAVSHYEQMLALRSTDARTRNIVAGLLMTLGRVGEAMDQYRLAIAAEPDDAETHFNLGNAFDTIGRTPGAAAAYRKAIALRPDFSSAHHNLGDVLHKLGQLAEAEVHYRRAIEIAPDHAPSHRNLGNVLSALNRHEEAILAYGSAIVLGSVDAGIHSCVGAAHNALGRAEDAYRAFRLAVAIEPRSAAIHLHLADCKAFSHGDERLVALEKLFQEADSLPEDDQIALHFALGKAFADLAEPERSFHHLSAGNKLQRTQIVYDEADTLEYYQEIEAAFTPDLLRRNAGVGDPSTLPVFVVGMPRSGTTLIEQILASHPRVFGAGEIAHLIDVVSGLRGPSGPRSQFPEAVTEMTGEALRRAGSLYLERVGSPAPDIERIVDKMPFNFQFLGLVHLALPNARVIHVRRDPLDTCFSCYCHLFGGAQPYAYDLAELGSCYRAYEGLMDHWRKVLPHDFMLEVRYEDVIDNLEHEARRIIDYCGLPWNEACLRFYETRRPVLTSSFAQVRQPIYRRSIGRWRPYQRMLQPLVDALGARPDR